MKSKLGKTTKKVLKRASRKAILESLLLLKRHIKQSRWIGIGNRYRKNTTERLKIDSKPGRTVNQLHLTQYVAASGPLHCADGWALLGRALDCHARRDSDSARHFAYYAELRAAISLLAAEGVAVFRRDHFVVDASKLCARFGGPTHEVAWQALEYWAELKRSTDLLGSRIRVNMMPLQDLLDRFPSGGSFRPVGSRWLKTWGLDLRVFSEDQEIRNEASYRPTKLYQRPVLDVGDSAEFICALWSLCEPSAQSPFDNLDRHLFRLALEETFKAVTGAKAGDNMLAFRRDVSTMLSQVIPDSATRGAWLDFLTRSTEPGDPVLIREARQADSIDAARQHLQMISRAALLLRVATAANSTLLKESGISASDLKFWWSAVGEERGLWEKTSDPIELRDLWADAEAAIKEIREWSSINSAAGGTFLKWRHDKSSDIALLGNCERIALWGLGL